MIKRLMRRFMMPPDCREVAEVLQAYLDGELPADKTHLVSEHLEHCERCGIEAEIYEQVIQSLQVLSTPTDTEAVSRLQSFAEGITSDDAS